MNAGTTFRIPRQGSGIVEFQVFNNGDATLAGALTQNLDVNAKQGIEQVNHQTILDKVAALPISEWSYIDAPNGRHIGPMAQDFYSAFDLGNTDKGISTIDTGGVALAAIQALNNKNNILRTELTAFKIKQRVILMKQQQELKQLKSMVAELLQNQPIKLKVTSIH